MSTFQASHIETRVQKAIVKKIQALNRLNLSDSKDSNFFSTAKTLEPVASNNPIDFHMTRNTFCRLSVDIPIANEDGSTTKKVLFFSSFINPGSERYGQKTQANRHITFNKSPFTNDKDFIWRGEAGIKSVSVTQKSFFTKELKINWACPDPNDFEKIIKPAFLKHGRFMVLEFGWGISDTGIELPEINGKNISEYMKNLRKRNAKSVDSYQAECGIVTSFGYDVDEQGGYSGTITIISRGDNVLNQTIENADDDETVTRFSPIRAKTELGTKKIKQRAEIITATFKQVIENLTEFAGEFAKEGGVKTLNEDFNKGALRLVQPGAGQSPRVSGTFVSWGWFEDHILNSFFKIDVTTDDGQSIPFQEFRSVHSATIEETSDNISAREFEDALNSEDINSAFEGFSERVVTIGDLVSNRCNNVKGLYSLGLDTIILPEQNLSPLVAENLTKEYERIVEVFNEASSKDFRIGNLGINEDTEQAKKLKQQIESQILTYRKVVGSFYIIDKYFKPFGVSEEGFGNIRNIVFNTEYLKSKFEGINSIQEGIRSLFGDIAGKYGGFFKFGLHQDEDNNGRMSVVDFNFQNDLEKSNTLLIENNTLDFTKWIEGRQSIGEQKMWRFGLFSKDSIIKDFSLSLQLTKNAATLALYGTGANGRFVNNSALNDLGIERFSQLSNAELYKKLHPEASSSLADEKNNTRTLAINNFNTPVDGFVDTKGLSVESYDKKHQVELEDLIESELDFNVIEAISTKISEVKDKQAGHFVKDADLTIGFDDSGAMGESIKRKMLSMINYSDIEGEMSNYQINKTIIPLELDMTIDGVGGLKPGNLFRIDYLPKIYRKYTYFQIFAINHSITTSGWSTSINAKMKLDFPKMIKDGLITLQKKEEEQPTTEQQTLPVNMDMSVPELETDIRAVGEFETATAESTSRTQYNNTNINFDGLSEQQRKAELEARGISDEPFDLDSFLNQTETPPPPPRPTIPTIDDPYDAELEQDFVIEETTLDDFEPWEPPPPIVPDESGIDEVEVFSGDVNVHTENDATKVKQETVKINVSKKADVELNEPKKQVVQGSFQAEMYSVVFSDGYFLSEVIGKMKTTSGETLYVYGQGFANTFATSRLKAESRAKRGASKFDKVGYNGYTGEPMGSGLIDYRRYENLKLDFKKKNDTFIELYPHIR